MQPIHIEPRSVTGLAVTTNNAREATPDLGRIGALWRAFAERIGPHLSPEAEVFGVYCRYRGDHRDDYDVLAGTGHPGGVALADAVSVTLARGPYLVFTAEGPRPQAIIATWRRIWAYFERPDCRHRRAFTTDFEHYIDAHRVDVHIAVTD